ncbi:MAG: glycosyltransferase family 9 protein [Desulfocurvibacter africanus]
MAKPPILILQMQRMGDTILTFPLVLWLTRRYPGHPVWIVAERMFYEALLSVSPAVTYFPWEGTGRLLKERFLLCLNLSHRPEAAELAGRVQAEATFGTVAAPDGAHYINGFFQLYRAALTHCNRHNRLHWADLNALDIVPLDELRATRWPLPRTLSQDARAVGLFVGASERAKRPEPGFWAALSDELHGRGFRPVLFGGPGERELAAEIQRRARCRVLNQAGRLGLGELAAVCQTMQLMITPDTGPMHLAAWTGAKVLNLSMGPVNPWETGPYQPGHYVLRAAKSCVGCWECGKTSPDKQGDGLPCHQTFSPSRVALLASLLTKDRPGDLERLRLPGGRLLLTARDDAGLYTLRPVIGAAPEARELVSRLWSAFFGWRAGLWDQDRPAEDARALLQSQPKLAMALRGVLPRFGRELRRSLAGKDVTLDQHFWRAVPSMARPLSSWLHLFLQNADYSLHAKRESLEMLEVLSIFLADS